ncbi:MAG: major capsid protein [Microvirus sp.]|nr:MAG: major capsid protein [Microvirus sp.]
MPKNFSMPKINVGKVNKRGKFDLSHDCSYTTQFAQVQPSFCKLMMGGSSLKGTINTKVRVMPLPLPPNGKIKLHRYGQFVPMTDVYKPFPEFLSGTLYSTSSKQYIPTELPYLPVYGGISGVSGKTITINPYNKNGFSVLSYLFARRGCFWAAYECLNVNGYEDTTSTQYSSSYFVSAGTTDAQKADPSYIKPINDNYEGNHHGTGTIFYKLDSKSKSEFVHIDTQTVNLLLGFNDSQSGANPMSDVAFPNGLSQANRCVSLQNQQKVGLNPLNCDYRFLVPVPAPQTIASDVEKQYQVSTFWRNGLTSTSVEVSGATKDQATSKRYIMVCVKLSEQGKQLKKILEVLGCQPSPSNVGVPFNICSLLAYYKAWFDIWYPQRNVSWRSTFVYRLIDAMQERNLLPQNLSLKLDGTGESEFSILLSWLFTEAAEFTPSAESNYFNAAVGTFDESSAVEGEGANGRFANITFDETTANAGSELGSEYVGTPSTGSGTGRSGDAPVIKVGSNAQESAITWNAIRLLRGLTKYINTNSVIGQQVEKFINAHFASSTGERLSSSFAGSKVIEIGLGDVIQTATTEQANAGDFAGVGFGKGDFKIKYSTDVPGYFFVIDSIIPVSNYVQGCERDTMIVKQLEYPTPEFDAIGYDDIKKGEVFCSNSVQRGVSAGSTDSSGLYGVKTFGYIPRYTGHKVKHSIFTGDFDLPTTRDEMLGFTLDNWISQDVAEYSVATNGQPTVSIYNPASSYIESGAQFKWIGKYKFMNNFDRIFANSAPQSANVQDAAFTNSGTIPRGDDFLVFNMLDVKYNAPLKSIGQSFDTIDGDENYEEHV